MNQKIWILFSLYRQDDDRKPINWATAVFSTKELANKKKEEIENMRNDIREVFIQENNIQTA